MTALIIGLVLFLGVHASRVFAEPWRLRTIERIGGAAWKGAYSVVSLLGFVLMVYGYGQARLEPLVLWVPPVGMRHLAALLMLLAFIVLSAAYVPGNAIKARVGHPMTLAVKIWAVAHLLSNGNLADVLLFGGFLVWAVLVYRSARRRDRAQPPVPAVTVGVATLACIATGMAFWAGFAFWAHAWLIGVRPFGG